MVIEFGYDTLNYKSGNAKQAPGKFQLFKCYTRDFLFASDWQEVYTQLLQVDPFRCDFPCRHPPACVWNGSSAHPNEPKSCEVLSFPSISRTPLQPQRLLLDSVLWRPLSPPTLQALAERQMRRAMAANSRRLRFPRLQAITLNHKCTCG